MMFWILIFALALAAAALLALALLRRGDAGPGRAEFDIAVYRDQLAAVDSDLARGVITEDAAARTRTEISRRILDADRQRDADAASSAPRRATLIVAALSAAALAGGSLALYARLGAPGYGDLPLKTRIERAEEMRTSRPSPSRIRNLPNWSSACATPSKAGRTIRAGWSFWPTTKPPWEITPRRMRHRSAGSPCWPTRPRRMTGPHWPICW